MMDNKLIGRALSLSILVHFLFFAGVLWSTKLSLLLLKKRQAQLESLSSLQVNLVYKPTDTPMRKGEDTKNLPPPKVDTKTKEEDQISLKMKQQNPKKKEEKKKIIKPDVRGILSKIRMEAMNED